jgi:RNA polymerase sigma-70 factor, ECF subfamily
MIAQHEDSCLIARVQDDDIDALGELYERHKSKVYRTAIAITHDERMAEDVLQEVFLRVYRYADSFDTSRPLGPWLYRITVNLSYSWTNRAKRWVNFFQGAVEHLRAPDHRCPERVAEERESRQALQQAIDTLPTPQRVVVILYYLEDLSVSDIAYVVGVPEGTVKSRLYYARKKLKEAIVERGQGVAPEVVYDFT